MSHQTDRHRKSMSASRGERKDRVFRPSRLTLARNSRGMSKVDLAAVAGLSPNSLTAYESAKTTPKDESVAALATALDYPLEFFYLGEAPVVDPRAVSFRALSRIPAAQRDRVAGAVGLAVDLDSWIEERFARPKPDIPDLSELGPVAAAEALRSEWGLGHDPIQNLVHVAERAGVRIYSLAPGRDGELGAIDALSMWWGSTPFVFLHTGNTVERMRHSLAHEVAHLVLHRDGGPTGSIAEKQANQFAGNFLLPASGLKAEARKYFSFDEIVLAKKRWKISALAYVYRMHEEGMLDEWRYKELCIKLRREYGSLEPYPETEPETSKVIQKVFADLALEGGRAKVAGDLAVRVGDLDELIFNHTLVPVKGSGNGNESPTSTPELRVLR